MSYGVVIVAYKSLDNIRAAVAQATGSSLPPNEIIVVINPYVYGSDTRFCMLSYVMKTSAITRWALMSDNIGVAKAFNLGISLCQSDYVVLLNDDCGVAPDTYEKMTREFDNSSVGVVGVKEGKRPEYAPILAQGFLLAFRKKMIEEIGGYDEIASPLACEVELEYRALAKGWRIAIAEEARWNHNHGISAHTNEKINYMGEEMSPEGDNAIIPRTLPYLRKKWDEHNEVIKKNALG